MASLPATSPGPGVTRPRRACTAPRPISARFGAGVSLERLYTLVPHVHLSVSLGRPGSSGSADPSRRCQGCSHPDRRLPARAALSFPGLPRQTGDGVFSPPSGNAAPRGAQSPRSRRWTGRTDLRRPTMERRSCNDRLKPPPTTGQFSAAVDKRIQHYRPAVVLTTGHRSALRRVDERVVE